MCRLNKALYGLKQVPHAWYEKTRVYLIAHVFCNNPSESTFYVKRDGDVLLVIVSYIDDMFLTRSNIMCIAKFKVELNSNL